MFRDRIFQTKAALTLYYHLHDVLTVMKSDQNFQKRFEAIKSQPDNYENIIWLCNQPRSIAPNYARRRGFLDRILKVRPA